MFSSISYPYDSKKYLSHSICGIMSSAPMSSAFVNILVFSFYFFDILIIYPRPFTPIEMVPPVCPCISSWSSYDESTHHFIMFMPSACRISGNLIVSFRHPSNLLRFFQSSSSGFLAHVVRKAISVYESVLHRIGPGIRLDNLLVPDWCGLRLFKNWVMRPT